MLTVSAVRKIRGFTLVELVIAIAVVALLAVFTLSTGGSDDTKTTVLLSKMQEVSSGLLRMKSDFSCFPKQLDGLLTPSADSQCGATSSADWKGNYIAESTSINRDTHTIDLGAIASGTELTFEKSIVGSRVRWMLYTKNLPSSLAAGVTKSCGTGEDVRCGFDIQRHEAFIVVDDSPLSIAAAPMSTSLAYAGPGPGLPPVAPTLVVSGAVPLTPMPVGPAPIVPAVFVPAAPVAPVAPMPVAIPAPRPAVLVAPKPVVLAAPVPTITCPDGTVLLAPAVCPVPVIPVVPTPPPPMLPFIPLPITLPLKTIVMSDGTSNGASSYIGWERVVFSKDGTWHLEYSAPGATFAAAFYGIGGRYADGAGDDFEIMYSNLSDNFRGTFYPAVVTGVFNVWLPLSDDQISGVAGAGDIFTNELIGTFIDYDYTITVRQKSLPSNSKSFTVNMSAFGIDSSE